MEINSEELQENYFFDKYRMSARPSRLLLIFAVLLALAVCYRLLFAAPAHFPAEAVVAIPAGSSLSTISNLLEEKEVIRSPILFRMAVRILDGQKGVKAGDYLFNKKENLFTVVRRLTDGDHGYAAISVVIPEGTPVKTIADILSSKLPDFDKSAFLKLAKPYEGKLFPDTYQFDFDTKPDQILTVMLENFDRKLSPLKPEIEKFGHSLDDVIKMASLVEGEGRTTATRKMIAGILWRRLSIGMPLQVDAAFQYVNGKNSFQLTTADLQKDSPYNTYTRVGLPPTPISNPGLDAILATINPTKSPYLYYLTDNDGVMHYAKTHDEHVINKAKYLQ